MYTTANIVLGLSFGDEGKGVIVNSLCSSYENPLVVRFSGGVQCGHTVIHKKKKHVHSIFGSGSLQGINTYLSEHVVYDPVEGTKERDTLVNLLGKRKIPQLVMHPLTKITTPFDHLANQSDKDNLQHGTCGFGVGKTMKRNEGPFKLYAIDLLAPRGVLWQKVANIGALYYKMKVTAVIKGLITEWFEALDSFTPIIENYSYIADAENLIFEGSQGILLDMDHGIFPNVTYANTTSKNALEILDVLGRRSDAAIHYVTRSYLTRHGAGWLPQEDLVDPIKLKNNKEETNVLNEFQGQFFIRKPNYDLINYSLGIDNIYSMFADKHLAITCLDQYDQFNEELIDQSFSSVTKVNSPKGKILEKLEAY